MRRAIALKSTQFTVVVSANDNTAIASLVKPVRTPHIRSTPGIATKYHVPLEITVNSHLIRRINTQNSKYQLCSNKSILREWRPNSKQSPPCVRYLKVFIPIELEVPINIESIVDEVERPIERDIDVEPYEYAKRTFDGSEKLFARSHDDYYHSQVATGDQIRSKRTKRTQSTDSFKFDTEAMIKRIFQAIWRRDKKK